MTRVRLLLIASGLAILALVLIQPVNATIQTQQAQIGITIVVPVAGTPLAYVPHQPNSAIASGKIAAALSLQPFTSAMNRAFEAQSLHFENGPLTIAQAQVQNPLLVQAEVTPNPKATILYSNYPTYTFNPVAPGATATTPPGTCAFTVTVDMTTAWSLEEGITSDFSSTFPGKDLGNNTYAGSTPQPTATPYVVYADDGSAWSGLASGSTKTTYCVVLTVTVPSGVTDGTYDTNAIYTLFN